MIEVTLLSVFLLGLFGGLHCAGMCGGIVSVIGAGSAGHPANGRRSIDIPVVSLPVAQALSPLLAYNLGRISTYVMLGMLAGLLGSASSLARELLVLEQALFIATNLLLIALGLYLSGLLRSLAFLETLGAGLWKRLRPLASRVLGNRSLRGALATGLVWGLVPCGMVYGVLIAALLAGDAWRGGSLMLAFGLGTLPNLLALGWAANRGRQFLRQPALRRAAGLLVAGFGVAGLLRLNPGEHLHAIVDVCIDLFR